MPGDSVSIISHTCWQWTALDVAIMSIGALTVPVYETNSPAQVEMIFNDANVKMAFAEDDAQRDKIESIRSECSNLGDIYVIGLDAIDTMVEYGHAVSDAEFQEREHAVKGSDLATIVYTSGSTGTPKGIELTHSNFVFITYSGINSMPDIAMKPNRRLLLFLPLAHVFARYMQFFCFAGNVSLGLSGNLKTILADFKAFKRRSSLPCRVSSKRFTMRRRRRPATASKDVFSQVPHRRRAVGRTHSSQAKAFRLS